MSAERNSNGTVTFNFDGCISNPLFCELVVWREGDIIPFYTIIGVSSPHTSTIVFPSGDYRWRLVNLSNKWVTALLNFSIPPI